jgi:hypothetical protein
LEEAIEFQGKYQEEKGCRQWKKEAHIFAMD